MNDEIEESVVNTMLRTYLEDERRALERFEEQARATLERVINNSASDGRLDRRNLHEAARLIRRLLAATAPYRGMLAKALGYQEGRHDAVHRAMMSAMEWLHNDPLPLDSRGGRSPTGRGHRIGRKRDECALCGSRLERGRWRADCPKNPPQRVRSKGTCAEAVATAAHQAGITNDKGRPMDSESVLKMYDRWRLHGPPREREHERLLRTTKK